MEQVWLTGNPTAPPIGADLLRDGGLLKPHGRKRLGF